MDDDLSEKKRVSQLNVELEFYTRPRGFFFQKDESLGRDDRSWIAGRGAERGARGEGGHTR